MGHNQIFSQTLHNVDRGPFCSNCLLCLQCASFYGYFLGSWYLSSRANKKRVKSKSCCYLDSVQRSSLNSLWEAADEAVCKDKGEEIKTTKLRGVSLLIVETYVVIADQYNQFCVGGMSEHPVEASHVVLPVLQREERATQTRAEAGFSTGPLIRHDSPGKLMRDNGISEGHPAAPHGWLSRAALIQTLDSILHLEGLEAAHERSLITSVLRVYTMFFRVMCL